jgi:hypothetical protein
VLAVKVKTNRNIFAGTISMTFVSFMLVGSIFIVGSSAAGNTNSVTVSVPVNQQVYVTAPYSSNFTILSVIGQGYSLQSTRQYTSNVLTFTPRNDTRFTILVNVSSSGSNYASVTKQVSPGNVPACSNCNFTGQGSIVIQLNVNGTREASQGSSWDPLFGMLPLRLQGFSLTFNAVIETIAVFGFLFLGLGIAIRSKIAYLGIAILFIIGAIMLGLLVMLGMIGTYLFGFAMINLFWKYKSWKQKK